MRDLERMARDYPDSPLPDEQRGDILRMTQRFPDAVAAYDKAIGRISHPTASDWIVYYDRGVAEERSHQWPKAKADFEHALQLSPDQPFVLNYLGYSMADMGHHLDEARQMIQTAAERRPNDGAITDSLGWVLFRQGHQQGGGHRRWSGRWSWSRRMRRSTSTSATPTSRPGARSRRSISGGAR